MVVRGVGVASCDLDVGKVDAGVEHRGHECVAQHVRVHAGRRDVGRLGKCLQAAGGRVTIHPPGVAVEEDRSGSATGDRLVDGTTDSRWRRQQGGLVAVAVHGEDAVTASFAERLHVGTGRLEHAQSKQSEHRDKGEVAAVGGVAAGGEDGLELQVTETERGDSSGTCGRRTYSAGECSRIWSITQVG